MHISTSNRRNARTLSRLVVLFFLITVTALVSARSFQAAPTSPQRFDGTWEASHAGKVIIVLRLHTEIEHPFGTIQLAGFQLDFEGDGSVMAVKHVTLTLSMVNIADAALDTMRYSPPRKNLRKLCEKRCV